MRKVYLISCPNLASCQQVAAHNTNLKIITSTPQAARCLQIPHCSWESLAQEILEQKRLKIASELAAHRALRTAVAEVTGTSDVVGIARAYLPALKAVLRAGINLDALKTVSSTRMQQLGAIAIAYQAKLHSHGLIEPAEVLWQAKNQNPPQQAILVYGYFHLGSDQLALMNAIASNGSVITLPIPSSAIFADNQATIKWLQQQGWQVEEYTSVSVSLGKQVQKCFLEGTTVPAGVQAQVHPHLEAEVRGALAQVKQLLFEQVSPQEIVLVTRDDAFYGPTILDIAWEYNLPVNAFYGVPLITTRLGVWMQLLLSVIQENFPFESTMKLLTHPLSKTLPEAVKEEAWKLQPSDLATWQSLGIDLSILNFPKRCTRADWVERLLDVLHQFQVQRQTQQWTRETLVFARLQEILADLSQPVAESIRLTEFTQAVLDSLNLLTVPAQPGTGGVELHTPLSLFGASYDYVFVLGAVEGILPTPIQDDPVMDFYERKQLFKHGFQLEGAAQAARQEAISFYALLQTAKKQLTFSYPQLIEREVTLKSPYLTQMGIEPVLPAPPIASLEAARKIYLRRGGLPGDPVLAHAIHAWAVEKCREAAETPDEYDGVVGLPINFAQRVFSASQLTALGQCPFRWFAAKMLWLQEMEEQPELNPRLKGNLYHRCLQLALAPNVGLTSLVQVSVEHLHRAFSQAEQELEFNTIPGWNAQRAEHLNTLSQIIQQPDFLPPQTQLLGLEIQFEGKLHDLTVVGRVDRLDRGPEGLVIWDYKASANKPLGIKDEFGKASVDIQLPLYIHVLPQMFPGESVAGAYYYSLTQGKNLHQAKPSETALTEIAQQVKVYLGTGYYPVNPDVEQKVCRSCPFDAVCRKGARNYRKRAML